GLRVLARHDDMIRDAPGAISLACKSLIAYRVSLFGRHEIQVHLPTRREFDPSLIGLSQFLKSGAQKPTSRLDRARILSKAWFTHHVHTALSNYWLSEMAFCPSARPKTPGYWCVFDHMLQRSADSAM